MVLKNLLRRKGRTLLTIMGIAIGAAAIVGLGALAEGLEAGYSSVLGGSNADLALSDPEAFDVILSSVDEDIGQTIADMPEVEDVSGLLQGILQTDGAFYFFIFGYPEDSFVLDRFQIIEGVSINSREADHSRGRPLMLGSSAAESLNKGVGDTLRLGESAYRIVGIYETGDSFEEGGAVMLLEDAQDVLGMSHQVSLFYIKLEDPALADRLRQRVERLYPDLSLTTTEELSKSAGMAESIKYMVWAVAGLAILLGGVGMMNAQLMAITERTSEIGVLRAVGWRSRRILIMILIESVLVGLLGGLFGILLGWLMLVSFKDVLSAFGTSSTLPVELIIQAFGVVFTLGVVGGIYPAYRASRLQPIEALRYEGGTTGKSSARLPAGGMAVQNLWRRKSRTLLTLLVICITIGSIAALDAILSGTVGLLTDFAGGAEVMVRQRDAADSSLAVIDEAVGQRIEALPEVQNVSGIIFTALLSEELGMFVVQGYSPHSSALARFNVVEGEAITGNRQVMLGRAMADAQNLGVGDTIQLGESRFRITGIFESGQGWEELGGIISLREAQAFAGRPRQVTFFAVDLYDPNDAESVVEEINASFPEVAATVSGEFAEDLPDMQASAAMSDGIALMAILVGGIGVMNTMLMAVLERTREIGVLRAMGWRRRAVLNLIIREALAMGIIGAVLGIGFAFSLGTGIQQIPTVGDAMPINWTVPLFVRAITIALVLGLIGGIYPALRATRLQPVEALRYE